MVTILNNLTLISSNDYILKKGMKRKIYSIVTLITTFLDVALDVLFVLHTSMISVLC